MLAGLPRRLTELYIRALRQASPGAAGIENFALRSAAHEAASLLIDATWHPHRGFLLRWRRVGHLTRLLDATDRARKEMSKDDRRTYRRWERETLRRGKQRHPDTTPERP